jgi:hypothetical protein
MLSNSTFHLLYLDLSLRPRIQTGRSLSYWLPLWQRTHPFAVLRVFLPVINTALLPFIDLEEHTYVSIGILPDAIVITAFINPVCWRAVHMRPHSKTVAIILQGTFRIVDGIRFEMD